MTRQFSAPGSHEHHETPLSKVMPTVVSIPRKVACLALGATKKVVCGLASSGPSQNLVSTFANKVIVEENLVNVAEIDVPFWSYWLSSAGFTSKDAFVKFAEAVKPKVAALSTSDITNLTVAFKRANYYDKDLFTGIEANVSANFTKFETEQLLQIVATFDAFNHSSVAFLDDVADSITYCNHYLAPVRAGADELATLLTYYAKNGHERADLLATVARGFSEVSLGKLSAAQRKDTVLSALKAFQTFGFYPESIEAVIGAALVSPAEYSAEELKEVEAVKVAAENALGGEFVLIQEGAHGH
eukprot:CAMPEP_0175049060 /NCGR_PEP_ID=MMETSP0052_2-20121109/6532_1 /TAXON_ID=51329 ORGANISM="Polytomella parva, Strain SAG 63-3" /NCGR_SAMPLE_ID=MMETSP0052_2 /ASSEMBLY_ACC=CAM_ASM_000194 /LENGTH=300 /DNA_ID=CAMNT_0016313187 /DNA_START=153 /DNA_END=1055 /DNA_ORIENTATION=-